MASDTLNTERSTPAALAVWLGWGLCVLVGLTYLLTLCRFAYPYLSAPLITTYSGLDPAGGIQHPIWGFLISLVSAVPVGILEVRCNLLSVPFAVLSVWLMFRLVSSLPLHRASAGEVGDQVHHAARMAGGLTAALFLAFSPPFWFAATRAHPAPLQVFLLLSCVAQLVAAGRHPEQAKKRYVAFTFLYGVAAIDFPTMYLLLPIFGVYLIYLLLVNNQFKPGYILSMVGSGLLGFALVLPLLWRYMQSPNYQWQELSGFTHLLWMFIKSQGLALLRSTPRVGWLLVALFSILPWFAVMFVPRSLTKKPQGRFGAYFLLFILYACGLLILFNLNLAPFRLMELRPLLVTPYVFVSCWFGYLSGFSVIAFLRQPKHRKHPPGRMRTGLARLVPIVGMAAIVVAAWGNYPLIAGRQAAPLVTMAEAVVDDLQGRTWLISNGDLEPNLALAAHRRGIPLKLISVKRTALSTYRRYLASLFESPRLKAMADIGLNPLLTEWSSQSPDWHEQVAVLNHPDLWYSTGHLPLPSKALYLGVPAGEPLPESDTWQVPAVWGDILAGLENADRPPRVLTTYLSWVRNHFGKLANNVGVWLADRGEPARASEAFQAAHQLDNENISVMLNRYTLAHEQNSPDKDAITAEAEAFANQERTKIPIWSLSYHYGYVRSADAFLRRGWSWALSGKPAVAIQELERAVAAGVPQQGLELALARLYYEDGRELESEQKYYDYLAENPADLRALTALSRIAMRKGDYDTARSHFARMLDEGAPPNLIRIELAGLELLQGNTDSARDLLEKAMDTDAENQRALGLLAMIAQQVGDEDGKTKYLQRLRELPEPNARTLISLSILAETDGDFEAARKDLERSLDLRPNHAPTLERLLGLDMREGRMDLAEKHARALLSLDPNNGQGNLVLGSIQYAKGDPLLAETSFRASVATKPTSDGLNSLAWILYERGALEEALELSQKALDLNPRSGVAWDTQGMTLLAMGRTDEAEQCLLKAMEYAPRDPRLNVHLAELYIRKDRIPQAIQILEALRSRGGELPTELFNEVTKLLNDVTESS